MPRSRRAVLAGVATISLAGCLDELGLGDDPTHELAPDDAVSETDRRELGTRSEVDLEGSLEPGWYTAFSFGPAVPVGVGYDLDATEPIDMAVLERREYNDRWREGDDEVQSYSSLSVAGVTGASQRGTVPAGNYRLVMSNSERYGTQPEGTAEFQVTFWLEI